ncbi:MAG: orotidine-5'-phosphate decarboxylase [Ostreibacterium sp.]
MSISPIIVALDFPDTRTALDFAKQLKPEQVRLKVGKELFIASGPAVITSLQTLGFEIFLDLKFHDIPNTVAKACIEVTKLGVWMTNVHASGGEKMMQQVIKELTYVDNPPLMMAVTVLTSMDKQNWQGIGMGRPIQEQVLHLAQLARKSGLDGVVCSAQEAKMLRNQLGDDFLLVTPGIRLSDASNDDDQHRIMTPEQALANGANYLVIGRPITQSDNPQQSIEQILVRINELA